MSRPISLVLILHDHQPIGNFDGVFDAADRDAYTPFLAFLESHPALRIALHTSGPLLEWFATHRPDYLARLRSLVERGQIEPWGGGFFEPVLPAIPERDRHGQIVAMADWLELHLGRRPRGLWLTERAWEPGLASSLADAGVEYVAVDDAHFVAAGFERDALWGWFRTEDQGRSLGVLPIHREMRYLIPFGEPDEIVERLARVAEGDSDRVAVLGDDGEKFGVWPGTHARCYEQGWLERFVAALEANRWIELRQPAEVVERHTSLGLAYLPTASYHEMQEWSLPPAAQERYHRAAAALEREFGGSAHDLLRGGHWRNFLARYPESNRMHKRMVRLSARLEADPRRGSAEWLEARTHLWRSQCNDAYWHGIFGGLYLPHLRAAIYRELIAAERFVAPPDGTLELGDQDLDGQPDALLESTDWAARIGSRGGALWAFDDRARGINYIDTLARREEYYHRRLSEAGVGGGEGASIHAGVRLKEAGLAKLALGYDTRPRDAFLDTWSEGGGVQELGGVSWQLEPAGEAAVTARLAASAHPAIEKRFSVGADGALEVEYALASERPRLGRLTVTLNLGLHVAEADDRFIELDGERADPPQFGARARHEGVTRASFVDAWAQRRLQVWTDRRASLERAPIETVSLSEAGAERVFQGLEVRYSFPVAIESAHPWRVRFRVAPSGGVGSA